MMNDFIIIRDWLKFDKLSLNASKSSFMFIPKQILNIKIDNDPPITVTKLVILIM